MRSREVENEIVERLSLGEPLAVICRSMNIGRRTVYDWQGDDEGFAARIARARVLGFDAIADECFEIADATGEDGERDVQRDKLRIETRLKLLAKWDPKRYGELIKHAGPDGEGPIQSAVAVTFHKTDAAKPD